MDEPGDYTDAAHVLMADVIPSVTSVTNPSSSSNQTPSIDVTVLMGAEAKETLQLQGDLVPQFSSAAVTYVNNDNNVNTDEQDTTPRNIKHRPTFTEDQITTMEAIFKYRQYLSPVERESVASATRLTAQQVRVWFQNRRQKAKQVYSFQNQTGNNNTTATTGILPSKNNSTGNDSIDISVLLAQCQKPTTNQIDPQLLQLLFSKKPLTDQNGTETNEESKMGNTAKGGAGVSDDSDPSNPSLGIISSNGTITITPQALLSLTPLLAQMENKSSQEEHDPTTTTAATTDTAGTGATTDTADTCTTTTDQSSDSTANNNTVNALQLLQVLSRIQNTPQSQNMTTPNKMVSVSGATPLRAQSPIPVEETLTPCNNNTTTTITPTTDGSNNVDNNNSNNLSSSSLITSEVLQQILEQTTEKSKSSWSITNTPTLPPALSLSLTSSAGKSSRKKRQVFSGHQIAEMEKHFEDSPYIDNKEREVLAKEVGLLPDQVKVWFQNRRTKKTRLSWRQAKEAEVQQQQKTTEQ